MLILYLYENHDVPLKQYECWPKQYVNLGNIFILFSFVFNKEQNMKAYFRKICFNVVNIKFTLL